MVIDREKVLAAAQKYVEKKRYDRAVVEYQKILEQDPNDARTLLSLGDLLSRMEDYAEAVATYERVGRFYASQGFALKAIAVYKQIREIIGRYVPQLEARYGHIAPLLADLYLQLGLTSDALAVLDEAATRLQRQGRAVEALAIFHKVVEIDPTNPFSHLRLAEALAGVKQNDDAVRELGVASEQLLRLGRHDDALKVIERLLQLQPDPTHARIAAELYLARSGPTDPMQALAKLQVCFQANRHDLETLGLLARAFTQIGQATKAIEVHKEMARIAREVQRVDLFREIVAKLQKLAPNDEGVKQLVAGAMASAPASREPMPGPGYHPQPVEEVDDDAYEAVGDGDIEPEQPIDLARPVDVALPSRGSLGAHNDVTLARSMGVAAEGHDRSGAGTRERVARLLSEAAMHRRDRRLADAIRTLRSGLGLAPKALELREMLRDLLLDMGDTAGAVVEMIEIAELLVESLDGEEAAHALQDALNLDPDNEVATLMLRDLGYELVEEDELPPEAPVTSQAQVSNVDGYGAPLPSYDFEEVGPEEDEMLEARSSSPEQEAAHRPIDLPSDALIEAASEADVDSPGEAHTRRAEDAFGDAPLPSFPLDGPQDGAGARAAGASRAVPELESALDEADFFASRGLLDDARAILEDQLARLPGHPLLLDRLEELDEQARAADGDSGTRPAPAASAAQGRDFDTVDALDAIDSLAQASADETRRFVVPNEQVDVEEVFAKFKAGVSAQIAVDDTQSHYDLGVAYKEMGLVDDALREFQLAAGDPQRACVCHSMIGMIQLERGHLNEAIEAFARGLVAPDRTKDQEAALCYELGLAYETKKMQKQALEHFQRTARLAPSFRDVQERIRRLQKADAKQPPRAVAVGADDEFDRAFNDILGDQRR
ncbi:MAG: tetratricopeptide repeat protein [Polyangiaceae bacterium]|nr:tetratricopeptide repeat protein [Polyangiaceae bacterium]